MNSCIDRFGRLDIQAASEQRAALVKKARAIHDKAIAESRAMTAEETQQFDGYMTQAEDLQSKIEAFKEAERRAGLNPSQRITPMSFHLPGDLSAIEDPTEDASGLTRIGHGVSLRQRAIERRGLSAGEVPRLRDVLKFAITGRGSSEARAGLSGNNSGQYLLSEEVSGEFVDLARANSIVLNTLRPSLFRMETRDVVLAKVLSDPAADWRHEGTAVAVSAPVLGSVTLSAKNVGVIVPVTRELVADSPNAAAMLESVIVRAMGAKIDAGVLYGDGTDQPQGIFNHSGIASTGSISTLSWAEMNTAAGTIAGRNEQANGVAISPAVYHALHAQLDSAGQYLLPPKPIAGLVYGSTSSVPTTELMIGDWAQLGVGIRQEIMLEVGTSSTLSGGEGFGRHETLIKATARIASVVLRAGAFQKLTGITV